MISINKTNFSVGQICESGQCFRLKQEKGSRYSVIAGERYLELEEKQEQVIFHCSREAYDTFWEQYFDLSREYGIYTDSVKEADGYLYRAVQFGRGIRILNQDLFETIVSFIISQQNHIRRIRTCIEILCEKYGEEKVSEDGKIYHAFPKAEALAQAGEEELRACNLGYRSRYIKNTARSIQEGEADLKLLKKMDYADAKQELLKLSGVGNKVADCICLFALHHLDAFPVDTHIHKVLETHYRQGFPFQKFKGCAGVMQQYLFYYNLKGQSVPEYGSYS